MAKVFLSLGSNLGDREDFIRKALDELLKINCRILKKSSLYETEPVNKKNQPWFLNCCVKIETNLSPGDLLKQCQKIENKLGRKRNEKFGPRTLDIDILFFDSQTIDTQNLNIPHPELKNRRFVLVPLAEIAPEFKDLLNECADKSIVRVSKSFRHNLESRL